MARKRKDEPAKAVPDEVDTHKKPRSSGEWSAIFLASLRNNGNVRRSCEAAGITRKAAYDLRDKDPAFAAAWKEALEDACDRLEEIAAQRAEESSDLLLIFLLKANRPEKYREKYEPKPQDGEGGKVLVLKVVEEKPKGNGNGDQGDPPASGPASLPPK